MKLLSMVLLGGALAACLPAAAWGHNEFRAALAKKYGAVSCEACHFHGEPKKERNGFGVQFVKELDGKDITQRLAAAKALPGPARAKVSEEVTAEFLAALVKVEAAKAPSGQTYGELLKAGKMEGVGRR